MFPEPTAGRKAGRVPPMLRWAVTAAAFALLLLSTPLSAQPATTISALDDVFEPASPQVPLGSSVTVTNDGNNPHTVTLDDGTFDSEIAPGESTTVAVEDPGRIPYYCRFHGAPGGFGMAGTILVGAAAGAETEEEPPPPPPSGAGETIGVP